jgi:DNA polymerase-3 subunit epsilon
MSETDLSSMGGRVVALDFETAVSYDHVIEIGCVEIKDGRFTGREFHRLVKPIVPIDRFTEAVHGINERDVARKPTFAKVVDEFLDFIGHSPILAHSEQYERNVLARELVRLGRAAIERERFVCTCRMARQSGRFVSNGLRNVCEELGIVERPLRAGRHDALADARMAGRIYLLLRAECPA